MVELSDLDRNSDSTAGCLISTVLVWAGLVKVGTGTGRKLMSLDIFSCKLGDCSSTSRCLCRVAKRLLETAQLSKQMSFHREDYVEQVQLNLLYACQGYK